MSQTSKKKWVRNARPLYEKLLSFATRFQTTLFDLHAFLLCLKLASCLCQTWDKNRKSARLKGSSLCVKQGAELCQETQESVFKNASGVPGRNTLSAVKTAVLSVLLQFEWCRLPETKVNYIKSLFISNKKDVSKLIIFLCPFHGSF